MKTTLQLFLTLWFVLGLASCANVSHDHAQHAEHQEQSTTTDAGIPVLPGTQQMIDSLDAVYSRIEFNNHPYEFERQLDGLNEKLKGGVNDPGLLMQYAYVNLQSGRSDVAISTLEEIIGKYKFPVSGEYKRIYDLLAISFLRRAEQVNCIENHMSSSCIVPIAKEAIHKDKSFSKKAIECYTKILRAFPDDFQSRWLLNIAYMTIGEYPDNVPQQDLIELEVGSAIPKFANVAGELGLDITSLAGGSIAEDFDNDGLVDLAMSSWGLKDQMRLFFNNGSGTFVEKTNAAGLKGITGGLNMIQADYNQQHGPTSI